MVWPVNAINIIERADWWADEEFRYRNSTYWKDILADRVIRYQTPATDAQIKSYEKQDRIDKYLVDNFPENFEVAFTQYSHGDNRLAWPVQKTKYIKSIMVHHTHSEYESSDQWILDIYRFHSVSREWWDVGYNYIIGYEWQIYEWRAGWDYAIAAHAKNNNFSTIWIALMWEFDHKEVPEAQLQALSELVKYLTEKYGIDLSKRFPMHKPCAIASDNCEPGWDVKTTYHYPLVGHVDAAHTSCPWEHLYEKIEEIRLEHLEYTKWFTPISYNNSLEKTEEKYGDVLNALSKIESKRLIALMAHINRLTKQLDNDEYIWKLKIIRSLILQVLRERS